MPELPEVETVVRHMKAVLRGKSLSHIDVYWVNSFGITAVKGAFRKVSLSKGILLAHQMLTHRFVRDVSRKGKWIIISFQGTPAEIGIHLRMTGRIRFTHEPPTIGRYDRVHIAWSPGLWMIFQDMRKFGRVIFDPVGNGPWAHLGIEPLDPSFLSQFPELLQKHRGMIKPLLLNQHVIAGVGNIYADESLHQARVHPKTRANSLSPFKRDALASAIPQILRKALVLGGTTIRDYRNAQDKEGAFQSSLKVYGRTGQPCRRCGTHIRRTIVGQRSTFYCPQCQG